MNFTTPDKSRIIEVFKDLYKTKGLENITLSEIGREMGVSEESIYYHFKDIKDLLQFTLKGFLSKIKHRFGGDLTGISGALNKLRKMIWVHIHTYSSNPVLAKMLLLDAKNCPEYYKSDSYSLVKEYSDMVLSIVEDGIESGEIRDDIPSSLIRQGILGCVENTCLTHILFNREFDADELTDDICELLFSGMANKKA